MLKKELVEIKKELLEESYIVSDMIRYVIDGIIDKDLNKLKIVIDEKEELVNKLEVKIEQHCINILGLFQPAAKDLREVIMIIKINSDLERIADLAVKCAISGTKLISEGHQMKYILIKDMGETIVQMLKDVVNSFVENDSSLAADIVKRDDLVDKYRDDNFDRIIEQIKKSPDEVKLNLHSLRISKSLERIADHITHISEDIVYILKAQSIRHQ